MSGPLPIQIGEVMAFCALAGIADPMTRMSILRFVQAMDAEYLRYAYEKRKGVSSGRRHPSRSPR